MVGATSDTNTASVKAILRKARKLLLEYIQEKSGLPGRRKQVSLLHGFRLRLCPVIGGQVRQLRYQDHPLRIR